MSLFSSSELSLQEHRSDRKLQNAFEESRKRHSIKPQHRQLLRCGVRRYLGSVNCFARIRWGQAVCQEFEGFFGLNDQDPFPDQALFFITLTDVSCITDHDASFVDIRKFKRRPPSGLQGLSYVGMIEPALYVNVATGTRLIAKKAVCWHLHAICWGESRQEIRKRFRRLNKKGIYRSIMNSQLGAHQKQIANAYLRNEKRTFLADKLRYMLKSQKTLTVSTRRNG